MGVINMVRLQISCNNQFYQKQMCITKQALFSYITWQKYFKINFFDTKGHHLFCMWVFRYTGIAYQLLSCTNVKKKKKEDDDVFNSDCDLSDRFSAKSMSFMAMQTMS